MGNLAQALLTWVDKDAPSGVVDILIQKVGNAGRSQYGAFSIKGRPSDAVALERVANGGAVLACSIASSSDSRGVLDRLVAKERRRGTQRALLDNPNLTDADERTLFSFAVSKADDETYIKASRRMSLRSLYEECARLDVNRAVESNVAFAFTRVTDRDDALLVLGGKFAAFALNVLREAASGNIEGLSCDEALKSATALDLSGKATALMESTAELTAAQAQVVADAVESNEQLYVSRLQCRLTEAAALVLYATGRTHLVAHSIDFGLSERLVALVVDKRNNEELSNVCRSVADTALASQVLPAVLSVLDECRTSQRTSRYGYGYGLNNWTVRDAGDLLNRHVLDGDQVLEVLRRGHLSLTVNWIQGALVAKPRPGDVAALVENPGWAFNDLREDGARLDEMAVRAELSKLSLYGLAGKPWAAETYELVPGLVKSLTSGRSDGVAPYVLGRCEKLFGDDTQLWDMFLSLGESFTGVLQELIEVAAVSCGRELVEHDEAGATGSDGDVVQPSLFDEV